MASGSTPRYKPSSRASRFGLRATREQGMMLRRAVDISRKSLTDFILDNACQAAEQALLDLAPSPSRS